MIPEHKEIEKQILEQHATNPNEVTELMVLLKEYHDTVKEMSDKLNVITNKIKALKKN